MASAQKEVSFTSTTSWVAVTALPSHPIHRMISIENYTDGDIEVAFGSTSFADFTIKQGCDKQISTENEKAANFTADFSGTMSIRNSTGTGGIVIIKTQETGHIRTSRSLVSIVGAGINFPWDYVAVTYPSATQEVYTFKTGGSGGTTTGVFTLNYVDSTKADLLNAART